MFGSTMARKSIALSGGANIFAQLAQEGTTEGDINLLSAGTRSVDRCYDLSPGTGAKLAGMNPVG